MALRRTPTWSITNSAVLFGPIVVGFGAFPSVRVWFIPDPTLWLYAFGLFLLYYTVAFYIGKRTSGAKNMWRLPRHGAKEWVMSLIGLLMFSFLAFQAFYRVIPAVVTSAMGVPATKDFTISSVDRLNPSGSCGTEVELAEVSPSMLGKGLCVRDNMVGTGWVKGARITLSGKESALGFRITQIGR